MPETHRQMGAGRRPLVILAPMAGVTDAVFRRLCAEAGADLTFTEMVSAKGLAYRSQKTRAMLSLGAGEERVGVQLFGHEPSMLASQAAMIEELLGDHLACIDINMGCPARKIVSKGDGAALLKEPELASRIVVCVKEALSQTLVTVKMRRGYEMGNDCAVDFAHRMEEAGADRVTVHGRFAEQLYHGRADWGVIKRVKEALSVPVCGNGDVKCAGDALRMLDETGCDEVMVARGAEGNPWIFAQIRALLEGREEEPPTVAERLEMARRHARLLAAGNPDDLRAFRKHAMWYVTGLSGASAARERITHCETLRDYELLFDELEMKARDSVLPLKRGAAPNPECARI